MTSQITQSFDKKEFEALFKTYFSKLCYFALKYVRDMDTAKEIVHDVFINLWEKRVTIDESKSVKSYLFTSVHNRCLNHIRDHKKFDYSIEDIEQFDRPDLADSSEEMEGQEMQDRINKVINSLPEKCREIFLLNRFDQLKYSEIAEKLDISIKTVETQMSKALKIMRENFKDVIKFLIFFVLHKYL